MSIVAVIDASDRRHHAEARDSLSLLQRLMQPTHVLWCDDVRLLPLLLRQPPSTLLSMSMKFCVVNLRLIAAWRAA